MNGRKTHRALVVDDDESVRRTLTSALTDVGIECEAARDGVMAENMLRLRSYDVVVTDMQMPRMHGHDLVRTILEGQTAPLIFVVTGVLESRLVTDLLGRGVTDMMTKPVVPDVFAAKVLALLKRHLAKADERGGDAGSVAEMVSHTTSVLKAQLQEATQSFEQTIGELEKQQERLEKGFVGSVRVLSKLLGQVDNSGGSHAGRVERISQGIARKLAWEGEPSRDVQVASLLHELGLFGMPDDMRALPPWEIGGEQLEIYQRYPVVGATLVGEIPGAENVADLVESHMENFDGSGFPNGISGDAIPLGARIIRIADGCDTFLMQHGSEDYWAGLKEHLDVGKETVYDPALVDLVTEHTALLKRSSDSEEPFACNVDEIRPGFILGEDLLLPCGQLLARNGASISTAMLRRLKCLLPGESVKVIIPD